MSDYRAFAISYVVGHAMKILEATMKNGDLEVLGVKARDTAFADEGTSGAEMTTWEFEAYQAYDRVHGAGACEKAAIDTMEDMFGKEFSDGFYRIKDRRNARGYLQSAYVDLLRSQASVSGYEAVVGDPAECARILGLAKTEFEEQRRAG